VFSHWRNNVPVVTEMFRIFGWVSTIRFKEMFELTAHAEDNALSK
jgi:hypothetical protein